VPVEEGTRNVSEPVEHDRNVIGCYALMACVALIVAVVATIGMQAPEKNELNIEITGP